MEYEEHDAFDETGDEHSHGEYDDPSEGFDPDDPSLSDDFDEDYEHDDA